MTPDKTEAQPEALRLAAEFEDCIRIDAIPSINDVKKSAAELRRLHAEIQQLKDQLSARQAAPDGWRLVPAQPTQAMCDAAKYTVHAGLSVFKWADGYYAMLSAAPPPPEREPWLPDFSVAKLNSPACWCETCDTTTNSGLRSRMSLCPDCGNKRCPKATHHDNACTKSNAPGQPGSSRENVKPHGATND